MATWCKISDCEPSRQTASRMLRPLLVACLSAGAGTASAGIDIDELSFAHGIAFFQELKYPSDFTHLDYLNPHAPKGGTLVLSTASAFNNLAPLVVGAVGVPTGFGFSSDTLVIRAGDEISAFYGRLADGIAVTDDRLAIVFRIHPDARWRDGVPITSDDVVFTLDAGANRSSLACTSTSSGTWKRSMIDTWRSTCTHL